MPNAKVTMLFNAGKFGWSETFYRTDDGVSLIGVRGAAITLASDRSAALGRDVQIEGIRITSLVPPNPVMLVAGKEIGHLNGQNPSTDTLWEALDVYIQTDTAQNGFRNFLMRGWPGEWVTGNVEGVANLGVINGPGLDAFKKFKDRLIGAAPGQVPWSLQTWNRSGVVNPYQSISSWVLTVDGWFKFTLPEEHTPYTIEQEVVIRGVKGYGGPQVLGKSVILNKVADNEYVINKRFGCAGLPGFTKYGRVRSNVPILRAIAQVTALRWVIRKTGRAFFVTRGARRTGRKC